MALFSLLVSIRRADSWLVEVLEATNSRYGVIEFQSAGRIIGWLKGVYLSC